MNDPWDTESGSTGTTWVYEYDRGGNILNKKRYAYTTGTLGTVLDTIAYGYDTVWKDKLTSYDGQTLAYDEIGNLTNDGAWTYSWAAGRQLQQMQKSDQTIEFAYNADGLRTQKKVTTGSTVETTDYVLHGKLVTHMKETTKVGNTVTDTQEMHFFYDAQSRPAMVKYNGVMYTYVHNLQGDIVAILNASGIKVVEYKYDAWGDPIAMSGNMLDTLGYANPFRYRGYVYDSESGLYYLRSRYYNTEIGRFVSADTCMSTGQIAVGSNVFCYGNNNCVIGTDVDGTETRTISFDQMCGILVFVKKPLDTEEENIKGDEDNLNIEFTGHIMSIANGEAWSYGPNEKYKGEPVPAKLTIFDSPGKLKKYMGEGKKTYCECYYAEIDGIGVDYILSARDTLSLMFKKPLKEDSILISNQGFMCDFTLYDPYNTACIDFTALEVSSPTRPFYEAFPNPSRFPRLLAKNNRQFFWRVMKGSKGMISLKR